MTSWRCHHDGLPLGLHRSVDVAKYTVAHHVHHRVHAACKLLWHRLLHHWLLRHHRLLHPLQHVYVLWVIEVVHEVVQLHLRQALGLQEILDLVQIEAHLGGLLQEGLLLLEEVLRDSAGLRTHRPHRKLLLDLPPLLFRPWVRVDAVLAHPVEKLARHLHERLFRQQVRVVLEVVEGDELHNVRGHVLAVGLGVECLIIAIERLHRLEVSIADTNNDDGEGHLRTAYDLVNCLIHVADHTVSDDHQDVELLVHLVDWLACDVLIHFVEDLGKVGRSVKLAVANGTLVAIDNLLDAVDARVEDVTVEGETVGASVHIGRNGATEPVQIDLLVGVVELEDVADALDGVQVLVPVRVHVVERVGGAGIPVGQGEVDSDGEIDRATTENVLEERMLALNSQVLHLELGLLVLAGVLGGALLELSKRHAVDGIENLVLAAGH